MQYNCIIIFVLRAGYEVLSMDNAAIVAEELFRVRQRAYELGLALQLSQDALQTIMTENPKPHDQILRITEEFLKREDPKPTWRAIIEALKTPSVDRPRMAQKIEDKFCRAAVEGEYLLNTLYIIITPR